MNARISRATVLRAIAALALLCAVLIAVPAQPARAFFICGDITIFYYSDPGMTHLVGHCTISCADPEQETCTGQQTQYAKQISGCHAC